MPTWVPVAWCRRPGEPKHQWLTRVITIRRDTDHGPRREIRSVIRSVIRPALARSKKIRTRVSPTNANGTRAAPRPVCTLHQTQSLYPRACGFHWSRNPQQPKEHVLEAIAHIRCALTPMLAAIGLDQTQRSQPSHQRSVRFDEHKDVIEVHCGGDCVYTFQASVARATPKVRNSCRVRLALQGIVGWHKITSGSCPHCHQDAHSATTFASKRFAGVLFYSPMPPLVSTISPLDHTAGALRERYRTVRAATGHLCAPLQTEDYVVSSMAAVSPTK